jgi:hypothetical protein
MNDQNKFTSKIDGNNYKHNIVPKTVPMEHDLTKNIITNKQNELLDAINPYPSNHYCFNLYEKTSEKNKEKMRKNIKINAQGNVEMM